MINLIITSSALHLKAGLEASREFFVHASEPNKDGKLLFPDGEAYVRIPAEGLEGRVVVLHSGAPHPNRGLAELESVLSVLRRAGKRAEVFFTYMPYSMQDKIHAAGETNAAEDLLRKLISYYGIKKVYAIEPHFAPAAWLNGLPFIAVPAHDLLIAAAQKKYPDAVFVAPDKGHEARTKRVKGFEKTRTDSYTVALKELPLLREMCGKIVGVVDDIIETGGTLMKFHEASSKHKPERLFVVATHGVLPAGIARVQKAYGELFLSNTIGHDTTNVDITPLIVDALTHER